MRLFNREPALILTAVATAIRMFSAFVIHLTDDQQTWLNAFVAAAFGLIVAFIVHDGQVAGILGFVHAILALGVGFGWNLSADNQALIMSFVGAILAAFIRTQVTAPQPAAGVIRA